MQLEMFSGGRSLCKCGPQGDRDILEEMEDAGVVLSVRKEKARHELPRLPPKGAVNFGVAIQLCGYLTSDCNPTSFQ